MGHTDNRQYPWAGAVVRDSHSFCRGAGHSAGVSLPAFLFRGDAGGSEGVGLVLVGGRSGVCLPAGHAADMGRRVKQRAHRAPFFMCR